MQDNKAGISLINYKVDNINYKMNDNFDFSKDCAVNIQPMFKRSIKKIDKDNLMVSLCILIEDKDTPVPFHLNTCISGSFYVQNWEENEKKTQIVITNTTAILFPFLRTLVANTTSNGLMPAYILPVMNINAIFRNKDENNK